MTYRERRLAKAERLREWAGKRAAGAASVFKAGEHYRDDHAFNTQPGHIPERARLIAREDRAHESLAKASSMASRATGIEAAADRAIYSDDPDAIEQLEAKIAKLTDEAELATRINKAWRKGSDAVAALNLKPATVVTMERTMSLCPWLRVPCDTTNTRANIRRLRERLEALRNPRPGVS